MTAEKSRTLDKIIRIKPVLNMQIPIRIPLSTHYFPVRNIASPCNVFVLIGNLEKDAHRVSRVFHQITRFVTRNLHAPN